jgi:hypothetical protein
VLVIDAAPGVERVEITRDAAVERLTPAAPRNRP